MFFNSDIKNFYSFHVFNLRLKRSALALTLLAGPVAAQDFFRDTPRDTSAQAVIAVMSADMGPYREALAGLQEGLGADIPYYILPNQNPVVTSTTKVVVAFGIKALQPYYPPSVSVVHALAPGAIACGQTGGEGTFVHISMTPSVDNLIYRLKEMQPKLRRLGLIWSKPTLDLNLQSFKSKAESSGISLVALHANSSDNLPEILRSINGQVDAIWLPMDPALLTSQNFEMIKEFSRGNAIPLYVPTDKLVDAGATASVSASFTEMGRTAALAVKKILARETLGCEVPPTHSGSVINITSANLVGIKFSEKVIAGAERVVR